MKIKKETKYSHMAVSLSPGFIIFLIGLGITIFSKYLITGLLIAIGALILLGVQLKKRTTKSVFRSEIYEIKDDVPK